MSRSMSSVSSTSFFRRTFWVEATSKRRRGFGALMPVMTLQSEARSRTSAIDKMDTIHQQLISKILRIAAMPANAEGGTIPLRYVVPPNEEIVLWDDGVAVAARSRDTLRTLALRYQLPRWSLAQINSVPDEALLTAGERIIVPRQLRVAGHRFRSGLTKALISNQVRICAPNAAKSEQTVRSSARDGCTIDRPRRQVRR